MDFFSTFPLRSSTLKISEWRQYRGRKDNFPAFSGNADIRHSQALQAMGLCCFSMTERRRVDLELFINGKIKINNGFFYQKQMQMGQMWLTYRPSWEKANFFLSFEAVPMWKDLVFGVPGRFADCWGIGLVLEHKNTMWIKKWTKTKNYVARSEKKSKYLGLGLILMYVIQLLQDMLLFLFVLPFMKFGFV